jgi:hypothetical protein
LNKILNLYTHVPIVKGETEEKHMDLNSDVPAPRLPLKLSVDFRKSYGRQTERGVLKNISLTGAFLEAQNQEVQPNDKILLTLNVSGRTRQLHAQVVWRNISGCGVKFLPSNNRDVQIVDDLMYFVENRREDRKSVLDTIIKKVS